MKPYLNHNMIFFKNKEYFAQSGIVYLSSKQSLLCFGGFIMPNMHCTDSIYLFNIQCKKWTKLAQKLPKPLHLFGCVASRNEKYVIMLSRVGIDVLDLTTMIFRKSTIDCPENGRKHYQAINMNDSNVDNLLTFGYVEFCNMLYPPFYLIKMIGSYYSNEWIYLIEQRTGHHWKIKLDAILDITKRVKI